MKEYFNIHNLVKIKIQSNIDSKIDEALAHWREFQESFLDDRDIDIFIYDYSQCPNLKNPIVACTISDGDYYSDNYLNIPTLKFCFNFVDKPLIVYCDYFSIPLNVMVELVLLNKGYSLIHSGAAQYNGKNYLFTAFAGIGKTTIVSALICSGGKLFGDDMNIVNEREILSYPLDFSISPYHLDILRINDKKMEHGFRKTKILDGITNRLRRYDFRVSRLLILILNSIKTGYVSVPPKKIFGENCIVGKGQIDEIFYLCKVKNDLAEITVERIDPEDLAEVCTNILFQEWHQSMLLLYIYSALSPFSLNSLFKKIRKIFRDTFMHYECYQLKVPSNLDNLTYQSQLLSYLKEAEHA